MSSVQTRGWLRQTFRTSIGRSDNVPGLAAYLRANRHCPCDACGFRRSCLSGDDCPAFQAWLTDAAPKFMTRRPTF